MILAHGVGTRADLPIPASLAALGAGSALVISFGVLALLWRAPRFRGAAAGAPLPAAVAGALDGAALRLLLRGMTLVVTVAVCAIGFLGVQNTALNLAPWAFYVTFWVGVVPASLLLGPVWRVLNPLRLLHAVLAAVMRIDPDRGRAALPDAVGYWPAVASLAAFAWFELVYPSRTEPAQVAGFVLGYAVVHTAAALIYGRRWFDRGDGFEVYSTLLGSLAPLGRRADGRLVLRNPLNGLDAVRQAPGLVGVVVVLVGSTAYDGLSRAAWWHGGVPVGTVKSTLALTSSVLLIGVVYLLATWRLDAPADREADGPVPSAFAHTIVPIAAGYAIAHYFSLLLFDGQQVLILASDPFGDGSDLLGTAGRSIDYTVVSTATIALVQVAAIVMGHLVAAVSAHDRAVRLYPPRAALRTQYPLLAAMVGLTMGAVGLVLAA
ncbi:MAG: hypothetical protein ACRDT0_21670 [Pseudonocardiaceae bacterium]